VSVPARDGRSAIRWLIVAPLWAGVLGAGIFFAALGLVLALHTDRLLPGKEDTWMILACFAATAVALFRGYDTPVRSYPALVGRLVGGLVTGALVIFGVAAFADAHRAWFADSGVGFAALGALGIALPLGRRHGRRVLGALCDSPSARWRAAAGAAALALAAACALSARVRCSLGSGASCFRAAQHAHDEADDALAVRLAERGCALDDDGACAMAGHAYWQGIDLGPTAPARRDRKRAEGLLRSGCALGAPEACSDLSLVELERGCEGYSASACHALGDAYGRGAGVRRNPNEASRFFQQACLLGDVEACAAR